MSILAYMGTNPMLVALIPIVILWKIFLGILPQMLVSSKNSKAKVKPAAGTGYFKINGMSEKGHGNIHKFDSLQTLTADEMFDLGFLHYGALKGQGEQIFAEESKNFMEKHNSMMLDLFLLHQMQMNRQAADYQFMEQQTMDMQQFMDQQMMDMQQFMDQQMVDMQQQLMDQQMHMEQFNMQSDMFHSMDNSFGNGMGF